MQLLDDKLRTGQTVLYDGKVLIPKATVKVTAGRVEVVAVDKNFNYNGSHCVPVYIDEL